MAFFVAAGDHILLSVPLGLPRGNFDVKMRGGGPMNNLVDVAIQYAPTLFDGLQVSLSLTLLSLAFGLPIGLLFAFGVTAGNKPFRYVSVFLVEVGRAPLPWCSCNSMYYGLPNADITLSSLASASLA